MQIKTEFGNAYGTPTNKKLYWAIDKTSDSKVSISSSGKLTVSKNNKVWSTVTVYAYTLDGSNLYDSFDVSISGKKTSFIKSLRGEGQVFDSKGRLRVESGGGDAVLYFTADTLGSYYTFDSIVEGLDADIYNLGFKASSSNVNRSGIYSGIQYAGRCLINGTYYPVYALIIIGGEQTGESKITVQARDGSGKKLSFKVYTY